MPNRKSATLCVRVRKRSLYVWRHVTTPSQLWPKIGRRFGIGHRAAFLLGFGLVFFAFGAGIALTHVTPDLLLFHTQMPKALRVLLWCGTGAGAVAVARHPRWQWAGFVLLSLAPVERMASYGLGIVLWVVPGGATGPVGAYLSLGAAFAGLLFVVRLIASWPDPPGDPT